LKDFNFEVDSSTDISGWQYSEADPASFSPPTLTEEASDSNAIFGQVIDDAAGGDSSTTVQWENAFRPAAHKLRRRSWCRIMVKKTDLLRALTATELFASRNPRGVIKVR
jgi:hypothetical protein